MPPSARIATALAVVGLVVYLDARSKNWAASELRARGPRTVAGGHLRLQYTQNRGLAFGRWGEGQRTSALIAYSTAVAMALTALVVHRVRRAGALAPAGLALMLAGTLGNLIDRVTRGFVVDFIDVTSNHGLRWPLFNIADAAILAGVVLCAGGLVAAAVRRPVR